MDPDANIPSEVRKYPHDSTSDVVAHLARAGHNVTAEYVEEIRATPPKKQRQVTKKKMTNKHPQKGLKKFILKQPTSMGPRAVADAALKENLKIDPDYVSKVRSMEKKKASLKKQKPEVIIAQKNLNADKQFVEAMKRVGYPRAKELMTFAELYDQKEIE